MKFRDSKKIDSKKNTSKEIPSITAAPGKVDTIIKALSGLESNIESLNEKLADMKKELNQKAQKEIDKLQVEVTRVATKEAEVIITESREKANSESQRIMIAGDLNLKDVQNKIDAKFNEAVNLVVSTVMKA